MSIFNLFGQVICCFSNDFEISYHRIHNHIIISKFLEIFVSNVFNNPFHGNQDMNGNFRLRTQSI